MYLGALPTWPSMALAVFLYCLAFAVLGCDADCLIDPDTQAEVAIAIGQYAFQDCTGLVSVGIPNSVTTVEQYVRLRGLHQSGVSGDPELRHLHRPIHLQRKLQRVRQHSLSENPEICPLH